VIVVKVWSSTVPSPWNSPKLAKFGRFGSLQSPKEA
jgi:hypothetical protein